MALTVVSCTTALACESDVSRQLNSCFTLTYFQYVTEIQQSTQIRSPDFCMSASLQQWWSIGGERSIPCFDRCPSAAVVLRLLRLFGFASEFLTSVILAIADAYSGVKVLIQSIGHAGRVLSLHRRISWIDAPSVCAIVSTAATSLRMQLQPHSSPYLRFKVCCTYCRHRSCVAVMGEA